MTALPVIIDRALFDAVQAGLETRRTSAGRPGSRDVLCRSLAFCGVCGRTMHVSSRRGGGLYQCASVRDGVRCGNSTLMADAVDRLVWESIAEKLRQPDLVEAATRPQASDDTEGTWHQQIAASERKLDRIEKQTLAIVEARAVGDLSDAIAGGRLDELRRQRLAVEREIGEARAAVSRLTARRVDHAALSERVETLRGALDAAAFGTRRALVEAVVPRRDGYGISLGPEGRIVIKGALGAAAPSRPDEPQVRSTSCTSSRCRSCMGRCDRARRS